MKILLLGDVMGPSGREAVKKYLPDLVKEKNIGFSSRLHLLLWDKKTGV